MSEDWGNAFTAEGFDFRGCTSINPDYCACGSMEETVCGICGEDIADGQEIYQLMRTVYPWWPDDSPDQAWDYFYMHEVCPVIDDE